jgi:hypothetical protein
MMSERCKERVMTGWHFHQCSRNAVNDGYCKQHHPESIAARQVESDKKFREKMQQSDYFKLKIMTAQRNELLDALKACRPLSDEYEQLIAKVEQS